MMSEDAHIARYLSRELMDVTELLVLVVKKVSVGRTKLMEHHVWHYLRHHLSATHILQKNMVVIGDLIIYESKYLFLTSSLFHLQKLVLST